jgi:hypothetical protein
MLELFITLTAMLAAPPDSSSVSVLALTPSTDSASASENDKGPVTLAGREAITMSFSQAIIALGSDFAPGELPSELTPFRLKPSVAGKLRWVTTSIARFDADTEWPPDLEITLTLNPELRSFDGRKIAASSRTQWSFVTPQVSMHAGRVRSASALALTNGTWSASVRPLVDGSLELPPDATIELRFSSEVSLPMVQAALRLRRSASSPSAPPDAPTFTATAIALAPCRAPSARCVLARLNVPLVAGALYDLVLPPGSHLHAAAGATHDEHTVAVSGLVPFAFPFVEPRSGVFRSRYRRLRLWCRHGLAGGVDAASIASQLSLTTSVEVPSYTGGQVSFTLRRRSAAVLELEAPLEPETRYRLSVRASDGVRDGFGLPLRAGSLVFVGARLDSFFLTPGSRYGRPSALRVSTHNASASRAAMSALRSWPALLRGSDSLNGGPQLATIHAVSRRDAKAAIASLSNHNSLQLSWAEIARVSSQGIPRRVVTSRAFAFGEALLEPPMTLLHVTRAVRSASIPSHDPQDIPSRR